MKIWALLSPLFVDFLDIPQRLPLGFCFSFTHGLPEPPNQIRSQSHGHLSDPHDRQSFLCDPCTSLRQAGGHIFSLQRFPPNGRVFYCLCESHHGFNTPSFSKVRETEDEGYSG